MGNIFEQQRPQPHLMHKHKSCDALVSLNILNSLINSAPDDVSQVHISVVSVKETGAWLRENLDSLCRSHSCHHCHTEVYQFATHNLSCRYSEVCHAAINSIVHRSLSADIPSRLEPTGLSRTDGKMSEYLLYPVNPGILVWGDTCPIHYSLPYNRDSQGS